MYKAKHGLMLGNKYLPFWQKGLGQTGGEKKKEEKRMTRRIREEKEKRSSKKIKGMETMIFYGLLWVYMNFYGWG